MDYFAIIENKHGMFILCIPPNAIPKTDGGRKIEPNILIKDSMTRGVSLRGVFGRKEYALAWLHFYKTGELLPIIK